MSKTYTASVLRRSASPRSNKLKTSATAASSSSYLSSVLINPAGSNDSVFWKYFGLDEDGGLYVKKTDAGEARNFWTYGQITAGGASDSDSDGGVGGVRNLWALDDIKKANGIIIRQDDTPVNDGDILVYGTIGTDEQDRPVKGWYAKPENAVGGGGTVTSIGLSADTGLVIGGSQNPITSSGSFRVGIAAGYKLPTSEEWAGKQNVISDLSTIRSNASNGQTAYNWGDHSSEGYLKSITGAMVVAALSFTPASQSALNAIEAKIPGAASSSNQLADKAFVNSSIATATATFRGTSAAGLTETQFLSWANGLTHDTNDYVFWRTTDSAGNTVYKRYKYTGSAWSYEYDLNNSSFTSAQWSAINSGITSSKVTSYDSHVGNGDVHVTTSQKSSWTAKQDAISDLGTIRNNAAAGLEAHGWGDHSTEGYLKAITSAMVVAALGFTPYNATNPNGYQANVLESVKVNGTALGISSKAVDIVLGLYACGQNGTSNAQTDNGNTYINLARNSGATGAAKLGGVKVTGSQNVTVTSNASGIITVTGPDLSTYVPWSDFDTIIADYQTLMEPGVDYVEPSTLNDYLTTANAASTYLPKTSFLFDIRSKDRLQSPNLNTIYDPSFGDMYGRFRYYSYVGATPWPPVSGTQSTAGTNGFPTSSNANALLTIDTYSDADTLHLYQLGFSGNGSIYYRNGAAVKQNGSWVNPWSNGRWNRLVAEDYNGDAVISRNLSAAGNIGVERGNRINLDANGDAYITRGTGTDYGLYICAGRESDGTTRPYVFFEARAFLPGASTNDFGTDWMSWNNIWAKRWYPNPGDSSHYIEWDSQNNAFKFFGNIIATGQITAGQ